MKLVKYNPFNEMALWNDSLNRFFNPPGFTVRQQAKHWTPAVDIVEKEDRFLLKVELPGVSKEEIQVNIDQNVLTVSGSRAAEKTEEKETWYRCERSYGSFKRAFTLSDDILTDDVTADYQDGVLTIALKKDPVKPQVKQITVN